MRSHLRALAPLLLAASLVASLVACDGSPVRWEPATADDRDAEQPEGRATTTLATLTLPQAAVGTRCEASLRVVAMPHASAPPSASGAPDHAAMGHGATAAAAARAAAPDRARDSARVVALWWSVRPDSSAWLVSARGTEGGATWEPAVPVDTFDRGTRGCARPAPAVAFEPATRYVHVAYWLDAPEGAGVFYAHSMDGGRLYDPEAEPIVYGERVARAAVAARGDTVVVAFEDPNTRPPQVALAVSTTGGHIFVDKTIRVSGSTAAAVEPSVALDTAGVLVEWVERQQGAELARRRRGRWVR